MSYDREGWILTLEEISAILSLMGREQFVGFAEDWYEPLQPQDLLNACCGLIRDRLMTQIDGKYRLCRGLAEVMEPVCTAQAVLVLTPGKSRRGRRMYYAGNGVTAMEQSLRGFVLTRLEKEELAEVLWEHMELRPNEQDEKQPSVPARIQTPREQLLEESMFLLEKLDAVDGTGRGWLRVRRQGLQDEWLEWTDEKSVRQEPLSQHALSQAISTMLGGEKI